MTTIALGLFLLCATVMLFANGQRELAWASALMFAAYAAGLGLGALGVKVP